MIFLNLEYVVVALLLVLSSIGQNLIVNPFCFLDSLLPDSLLSCFSSSLFRDSLLSLTNSSLFVLSCPNSTAQYAVSASRQFEMKLIDEIEAPRTNRQKKIWRKFFRPQAKNERQRGRGVVTREKKERKRETEKDRGMSFGAKKTLPMQRDRHTLKRTLERFWITWWQRKWQKC